MEDGTTFVWITAAIGFLWTMLVGYISRWWYGANVFCSGVIKLAQGLLSSLLIFAILVISFMQMLYLIERQTFGLDERCISPDSLVGRSDKASVCSIWDSFKVIFLLIVGERFLTRDSDANIEKSATAVVLLVVTFVTLAFLLLLQMISVSIKSATSRRVVETTADMFWAPILTFIYLMRDLRAILCRNSREEPKSIIMRQRRCCALLEIQLESMWEYLCASYSNVDLTDTKWWYLQEGRCISHIFANKWIVRFAALFIIPIWLLSGLFALGMTWPSQVRWWIFTWTSRAVDDSLNEDASKQTTLSLDAQYGPQGSSELSRLKAMIYERFHDVQDELQNIRDALPD